MNRDQFRKVAIAAALLVSLACASSAQATVGPAGAGEPATTAGS